MAGEEHPGQVSRRPSPTGHPIGKEPRTAGLSTAETLLALQRTAGNRAVAGLFSGRSSGRTVQRYVTRWTMRSFDSQELVSKGPKLDYQLVSGRGIKVSDDGHIAVPNVKRPKEFFASQEALDQSNRLLEDENSHVELYQRGSPLKVWIPGTLSTRELRRVLPKLRDAIVEQGKEYAVVLAQECSDLAHLVMGGGPKKGKGLRRDRSGERWTEFDYNQVVGSGVPGENTDARPEVGEAFATFTAGAPIEGSPFEGSPWNFHFAGVVARRGEDTVTLENYTRAPELEERMTAFLEQLQGVRGDLMEKIFNLLKKLNWHDESFARYATSGALFDALRKPKLLRLGEAAAIQGALKDAAWNVNETRDELEKFLSDANRLTLWYFQMYGSPKKPWGVWPYSGTEDQSYHAAMEKTGDFNQPATLNVRKRAEAKGEGEGEADSGSA